jgi:hypothetical protein
VMSLACVLGLLDLVKFIVNAGKSTYFIGGVLRNAGPKVMKVAVVSAITSRVSDEAIKIIMKDDRLPLQLDAIDNSILTEIGKIGQISDGAWEFFGGSFELDWQDLREDTLMATMACAGYIHMHLRYARRGFWALLRGDRLENLRRLAAGPPPKGTGSEFKAYEMMRLDQAEGECLAGLALAAQSSWSTLNEESGHKVSSGLIQSHRDYGTGTLQARVNLTTFSALLADDKDEKLLKRLRQRAGGLDKRQPKHFTGRQLFLRELHVEKKAMVLRGRVLSPTVNDEIMKKHGKRWAVMESMRRIDYEQRAKTASQESADQLELTKAHVRTQIFDVEVKLETKAAESKPCRLSNMRLTIDEEFEIENLWEDPRFSAKRVMDDLPPNGRKLHAPGDVIGRALESIPLDDDDAPAEPLPDWIPVVCWNRNSFVKYGLKILEPSTGVEKIYRLSFALQSPLLVCAVELREVERVDIAIGEVGYHAAMAMRDDHVFSYNCDFHYSDDAVWSAASTAQVLPNLRYHSDNLMVANGDWRPWAEVRAWFPDVPHAPRGGETATSGDSPGGFEDDVWTRNPWMANWLKFGNQDSKSCVSGGRVGAGAIKPLLHPYAHLVEAADVMDVLEAKRHELDLMAAATETPDYRLGLRGGDDLFARTGRHYDAVRCECASDDAENFARNHKLKLSFGMDIDMYDESDCKLVCRQWGAHCQHFLNQYRDNAALWEDAFLEGWVEDPELAAAYARGSKVLRTRIDQVRRLRPKLVDE